MKRTILQMSLMLLLLAGCGPSQRITGYWVNKEASPKRPFKNIFVFVITDNKSSQVIIENQLADLFASRGKKVMLSSELFPPKFTSPGQITKEQMAQNIAKAGCDAVFTLTLLDVKTVERYQPGTTYAPMGYGFYGNYYGYYNHYYPVVYSPGYYSTDKTYYIENNFYDVATDELLYSIQSEAYNPSNLESWFKGYSEMILYKLRQEGLIGK
jgi:hypothetical protein